MNNKKIKICKNIKIYNSKIIIQITIKIVKIISKNKSIPKINKISLTINNNSNRFQFLI